MNDMDIEALVTKVVNDTISSPAMQAVIEKTSTTSAEKAITNAFIAMGIDAKNPLEVQQDMQFVRYARVGVQTGVKRGIFGGLAMLATGIVGGIGWVIHDWLRTKGLL